MAEIVPVTEWPDYATTPTGGDVMTQDLNAPYDKVRQYIYASLRSNFILTITIRVTLPGFSSAHVCAGRSRQLLASYMRVCTEGSMR